MKWLLVPASVALVTCGLVVFFAVTSPLETYEYPRHRL